MYYINVSQLDQRPMGYAGKYRHVFGTRDDIGYNEVGVVLQELRKRFPVEEGYKVTVQAVVKSFSEVDDAEMEELLNVANKARELGNWPKL